MKTWEVNEWCQNCEEENSIQWNTEEMGYVAECTHCGAKLMLCDECRHEYDKEKHIVILNDYCDWCNDAGGVCYRDTSPVELSTYGAYDEENDDQSEFFFEVPKNWLWKYVKKNGYKSIDEFLDTYTWDTTMDTYARALEDKVVINEWEV